jgi:hypothetical protein
MQATRQHIATPTGQTSSLVGDICPQSCLLELQLQSLNATKQTHIAESAQAAPATMTSRRRQICKASCFAQMLHCNGLDLTVVAYSQSSVMLHCTSN